MQVTDVFLQQIQGALAGRYQVERQIGRGATATVYLARDLKHDRPVAVKVLRPELSAALGAERFLVEIKVAAGLQHPHILPLYDSGDAGGTLYYVMPFVVGESLRDRLNREPQLPLEDALRITREVADALAYAHEADIVHRDIKPENILLSDGHAVVADFGIARAINRAGGEGLTETGVAIGTPVYMSPEQASGERYVDGRTDIYSLGCVLYEMLAGKPPFTGPTTIAVIAHRFSDPPVKLRSLRPDVPPEIENAVETALSDAPADRFRTAGDFELAVGGHRSGERPVRRRSRAMAGVLGAAIVAVGIIAMLSRIRDTVKLDESLFVVLPFEHRMGAAPKLLNGNQCEILLHDALARWNDVKLVPEVRVNDARARLASASITLEDALRIARGLGAANLAWGEVSQVRDSLVVRAYLYDVRRPGDAPRERTVRLGADLAGAGPLFESLADSLLLGSARSRNSLAAAMNTSSLAAWRLYDAGHDALRRWNLDSAARAFQGAADRDPEFANAHLMLAQTMSWSGASAGLWQAAATRAVALGQRLPSRERHAAGALAALGSGQNPQACERYTAMLAADSSDFAAWYGLGECRARDQAVVRDSTSPSGWRYRSSYHSAITSYRRALELVPSSHGGFVGPRFDRLARLLYIEPMQFRRGYALLPDSGNFAAFPWLAGDTVAFIPYPLMDVMEARAGNDPASHAAALARTRSVLTEITSGWARAFPRSPGALEALARLREQAGIIANDGVDSTSAIHLILRARSLDAPNELRDRLAVAEIRLRLKQGDLARTRVLADSLIAANNADPAVLAPLAALLGRPHRTAALLRLAAGARPTVFVSGQTLAVPLPVAQTGQALLAYASFAAPLDSLMVLVKRLNREIDNGITPSNEATIRRALLEEPLTLAHPLLQSESRHVSAPSGSLRQMQNAQSRGDTAFIRREMARIARVRGFIRLGDNSLEGTVLESELLLALGDTTAARRRLAVVSSDQSSLSISMLDRTPAAAAFGRGLVLRARIAVAQADSAEASNAARQVLELWYTAEPLLSHTVQDMQRITETFPPQPLRRQNP